MLAGTDKSKATRSIATNFTAPEAYKSGVVDESYSRNSRFFFSKEAEFSS
jgi:hypothetical protein